MDGFDETLAEWKDELKKTERRARGHCAPAGQGEDDETMPKIVPVKKGTPVSRLSSGALGSNASSVSSEKVKETLEEDEKRARDNQDDPQGMQSTRRPLSGPYEYVYLV